MDNFFYKKIILSRYEEFSGSREPEVPLRFTTAHHRSQLWASWSHLTVLHIILISSSIIRLYLPNITFPLGFTIKFMYVCHRCCKLKLLLIHLHLIFVKFWPYERMCLI